MKEAGGHVVLNAAPARLMPDELASLVDVVIVNAIEAEQLAGVSVVDSLSGALDAAKLLTARFPVAVVTAGGEGVACASHAGEAFSIPAVKVQLVSTHGAGDEFTGVFAAELARGSAIREALDEANRAAAVLVSTQRTN